jgi:hypothetical protein
MTSFILRIDKVTQDSVYLTMTEATAKIEEESRWVEFAAEYHLLAAKTLPTAVATYELVQIAPPYYMTG